ncbi:MAG: hypothetical protein IPN44_15205 [Flavobacteriales bacterium]|nr:hypothetical protein [Flavobacteriales bacterium]
MVATGLITSCTKDGQQDLNLTAELQMQYNSVEFTIPPTPTTGAIQLSLALDGQALAQTLSANGYSMDQLKEFHFTNATLHIESPDSANYNAFQSISLQLSISGGNPVTVASMDPVPDGVHSLTLNTPGDDVAQILQSANVQLIASVVLDGLVTDTVTHKLDLGGRIKVKL